MSDKNTPPKGFKFCGCDCGELIPEFTKKGKPQQFAPYHYFRLPINKGRKIWRKHPITKIGFVCGKCHNWIKRHCDT